MRLIDSRHAIVVASLSLASAATEGLGLLLLVPMLQTLGGSTAQPQALGDLAASLGVPNTIVALLGLFVGLVFLRGAINMARALAVQRLESLAVDGLRTRAWDVMLHCDWRTLSELRQSDSASLLINSVDRIGLGLNQLISAVVTTVTLFGIAIAALIISPTITLVAIAGGALVLLAYRRLRRRASELGEAYNEAYAQIHAEIGEGLGALRIVKSFGMEDTFSCRLRSHFAVLRSAQRAFIRDIGVGQIVLQGAGATLLAVVVWLAISVWHASVAVVLPMVALFARALPLLDSLQQASQNFAHTLPALSRALSLLSRAEKGREPDPHPGIQPPTAMRSIRLERVSVSYPGRHVPALDSIELELRPGTILAIVGPSGAGKSTLADVMSGLISPNEGQLVIDDVALDSGLRRAWRRQVSYVQQDPILFTGTVRENMLLAHPRSSSAEIMEALRRASAGFVEQMPAGIDTPIGERGLQLSGGERQRIALARALLRRPRLLILDEIASALDSDNEAAIASAVEAMRGDMAIFIIGHRGSLADIADEVVRLERGRIV